MITAREIEADLKCLVKCFMSHYEAQYTLRAKHTRTEVLNGHRIECPTVYIAIKGLRNIQRAFRAYAVFHTSSIVIYEFYHNNHRIKVHYTDPEFFAKIGEFLGKWVQP